MPGKARPLLEVLLVHRWNIAILAELERGAGAKFVTLANRLSIGRASLTRSLRYLVARGLVRRNTGYGHPLRPEYLLTPAGATVAPACLALATQVAKAGAAKAAYSKWGLPLLAAIGEGAVRFNALRGAVGVLTPRAQTLALKSLEAAGWVVRDVDAGYPPVVTYRASEAGRAVQRILVALPEHA